MPVVYFSQWRARALVNLIALFAAVPLQLPKAPTQSSAGPVAVESPRRPWIVLTIEDVNATTGGYAVHVKVQNDGKAPVMLIARREERQSDAKPYLNLGLEVDEWDEKLGWQFVGPACSSVPIRAVDAYTFKPEEVIQNTLSVRVPLPNDLLIFCPGMRSARAGGKVRVALYCAYDNEQQFLDERLKPPPGHSVPCQLESVSKAVRLPAREHLESEGPSAMIQTDPIFLGVVPRSSGLRARETAD